MVLHSTTVTRHPHSSSFSNNRPTIHSSCSGYSKKILWDSHHYQYFRKSHNLLSGFSSYAVSSLRIHLLTLGGLRAPSGGWFTFTRPYRYARIPS
jgi:hypothetical protein